MAVCFKAPRSASIIAAAACLAIPVRLFAVDWNATDPGSSAISVNGLTDNYGQFTDESVIYNNAISARGTATYLGNGWVLTAQHVVEGTGGYGTLAPVSQIQVNIYGTYYTGDTYTTFGSSDIMLLHLAGSITSVTGVERSQIYTGSSETGNLEQLGGFGYYGQLNSGTSSTDASFHRGFNIASSDGGFIDVSANGNARLVQDGYLLGYQQSGDSGSALWMDDAPDQDLDLHDWSVIGVLDTGTTPGYFGDGGQYARVSSYASTIINTVFPYAWLTWNANTASTTPTDGSGTWNLTTAHFTDGTNYDFNGPERTQIATFGARNGAAGTVTLGANISADSLTFNAAGSGNYTIAGGGFTLTLTQGSTITTNVNATITAPLSGGSSSQNGAVNEVTKNGAATLTLAGPATLSTGTLLRMRAGGTVVTTGGSVSIFNAYTDVAQFTGDSASLTVAGTGVFTDTGSPGDFNLGDLGGSGVLTVQDSATLSASNLYVGKGSGGLTGAAGTGTVNLTGGKITVPKVSLATLHPASNGTFNLTGGTLVTSSITGGLGTSTFNFLGGQINASAASTTFLQNLTTASVNAAALINTNGYSVTLNQPLTHSSSAPVIDGGLTKSGNGTLTLGGGSSYTGPTVINTGTITLSPSAGAAAVAVQPVAWYSFDNVSGSTVVNTGTGGTAMNGTLTGNASIVAGGKFGNAVSLSNGGSVVVNNAIEDTGGAANWTISAWVHTTTPGAAILDKGTGTSWAYDNSVFYLGGGNAGGSGGIPSAVRYGRGFFQANNGTPSVDDGTWHLVTYVDAAGSYSIYTDGNKVALSTGNAGFEQAVEQGSVVSFGITTDNYAGDGTVNFNGLLDEIQLYNRALTATQIKGLYTSDSPNPAAATSILPVQTPVTLAGGTTLNLAGNPQSIGSLSGSGSVTMGSGNLTIDGSTNTTFSGVISGSGSVFHTGNGMQALGGADTYTGSINVSGGVLNLGIGTAATVTSLQVRNVSGIYVSGGSLIAGVAAHQARTLFVVGASGVTIGGMTNAWNGTFDSGGNDVDWQNGGALGLASVANQLLQGFAGGAWSGSGISSAAAAADTTHLTALGAILNNNLYGSSTGSLGTFDTVNPGASDVLIKYTYYGDANLSGVVDGSDYSLIDYGYLNQLTGWYNGDFNYDGTINGSDYTLIDNSYNSQYTSLATQVGSDVIIAAQLSETPAVPEPGTFAFGSFAAMGLLVRTRRRCRRSP